ncbi:site-2 protease family protein [Thioalkalivibrio thiocyanodenitrificans]|uniref:site-2 protease family protein n=1 Tax=Thioalkalivibrio thiocyanodenitrificans TaxID=243063 RepID=UPI00036C2E44|nr:site-2 protease family protein [Thioalkalivibrio thiocyanodenitrificans]
MDNILQTIAIWAIPVLFAITLHEVSHGWVAKLLGDTTAQMLGRLTVNPLKHIDPVGTVLVPLAIIFYSVLILGTQYPIIFGWAKPVPVNSRNLRHPQRDMAIVAAAGPLANLVMAMFWALMIKLGFGLLGTFDWVAMPLIYMGMAGITINIVLMVLNLLPVPPLDGGRVVSGFLPPRMSDAYDRIEPYGLFIILGLLATGMLWAIIGPFFGFFVDLIRTMFTLPPEIFG